jgi:uncharacterized protein involved in type VI secretion and phage assembly
MSMTDADDNADQPQRHYGKYAGLVTDNAAPSSGSHLGQVKVKVLGILEETSDGNSHQPIEVLAAPAFLPGFFFVPEKDAPVWVEFVAGDINHPIWTGVWYPDDATPKAIDAGQPTQAGSAPTLDQKVIRTKSGQVIQLDDTDGSEQLVVKDEKNGNAVTFSSSGIAIEDATNKNKITFDSNGITLKSGDDNQITITSSQIQMKTSGVTVTIDSSKMEMKTSGVTVTIDSSKMDVS